MGGRTPCLPQPLCTGVRSGNRVGLVRGACVRRGLGLSGVSRAPPPRMFPIVPTQRLSPRVLSGEWLLSPRPPRKRPSPAEFLQELDGFPGAPGVLGLCRQPPPLPQLLMVLPPRPGAHPGPLEAGSRRGWGPGPARAQRTPCPVACGCWTNPPSPGHQVPAAWLREHRPPPATRGSPAWPGLPRGLALPPGKPRAWGPLAITRGWAAPASCCRPLGRAARCWAPESSQVLLTVSYLFVPVASHASNLCLYIVGTWPPAAPPGTCLPEPRARDRRLRPTRPQAS